MSTQQLYRLRILLEPIAGARPERIKSSYRVTRRDGTLVKDCPFINNDPRADWARVDAWGAINSDAGRHVETAEVEIIIIGND